MHPRTIDMTGNRYGRLVVVKHDGKMPDNHTAWLCQCDCGNTKRISSNSLRRKNHVKSCGCMNKTVAQTKKRKEGSWNEGKSYAINNGERCYKTRHAWSKAVIRHYGNACQLCGWDKARCDAHHRVPKGQGGLHTIGNGMVLCPNCHRIEHEEGRGD